MSRNSTTLIGPAGLPVTITIGWDRPLREYFSNVLPEEEDDSDYSAVVLARFDSVSKIAVAFLAAALALPQAMLDAAELEGMNDAGNVLRWFGRDGAVIQENRC